MIRSALVLSTILATSASQAQSPAFHVERVGDSVFAIIRHDPEAMANNANSLVVIGGDAVLVVDAQFTREATLQTLAAIRGLTSKPVRYVVNTHWHDDHVAGNQIYRDTFPNVDFISHVNTRRDLATLGADNRNGTVSSGEGYVARLERLMRMGLGFDSTALAPTEADALHSTATIVRRYIAEAPGFHEMLATITFEKTLNLDVGGRRVDVHWFGPANTNGDAVVHVPDANVVATGDLVVFPVPFAFNSHIGSWVAAMDSLRALKPIAFVPGHGPVMHDDSYIAHVQRMLARIRDETRAAVAHGDSLAAVRRKVTLRDELPGMAGDDKWKRTIFNIFFVGPAVGQAYAEALEKP